MSKYNLTTNEQTVLTYTIKAKGSLNIQQFIQPDFIGFIKNGASQQSGTQNINGNITTVYDIMFYLRPNKTGKITIKPATFVINNKKYTTENITVNVTKGKPQNKANNPQTETIQNRNTLNSKDIFIKTEVSKSNPYLFEPVILTYKLYIKEGLQTGNFNETELEKYNGFWAQDIKLDNRKVSRETIDNIPYKSVIIKKKLLFPQRNGKLSIEPLSVDIDVQRIVYREIFGRRIPDYDISRETLKSKKITITPVDLPQKNKPADFSGAVGNFNIKMLTDKNSVKAGEPVNIRIEIKGSGNLKLFDIPELKVPEDIDKYDPQHKEQVYTTTSGNTGVIKDEYILVPGHGGKFIIPPVTFTYFDVKSKSYVSKTTDKIVLLVSGNMKKSSVFTNNNKNISNIKEFRFIKDTVLFNKKTNSHFYKSKLFYFELVGIASIMLLLFGYKKYLSTRVYDASYLKQKKSKSLAEKFLKDAKKSKNNKELFYANLEKAFHNFIKANLKIDSSEMSKENIQNLLRKNNVSETEINKLIGLLNNCDMARYSPAGISKIEEDYDNAVNIMSNLFN